MARKEIVQCDICGVVYNGFEQRHWSDCIRSISLSFKNHPAIQRMAFDGDCCPNCAMGLEKVIKNFISDHKPPATDQKEG